MAWPVAWAQLEPQLINELDPSLLGPLRSGFGLGGATSMEDFFKKALISAVFNGVNAENKVLDLINVLNASSQNVPCVVSLNLKYAEYFPGSVPRITNASDAIKDKLPAIAAKAQTVRPPELPTPTIPRTDGADAAPAQPSTAASSAASTRPYSQLPGHKALIFTVAAGADTPILDFFKKELGNDALKRGALVRDSAKERFTYKSFSTKSTDAPLTVFVMNVSELKFAPQPATVLEIALAELEPHVAVLVGQTSLPADARASGAMLGDIIVAYRARLPDGLAPAEDAVLSRCITETSKNHEERARDLCDERPHSVEVLRQHILALLRQDAKPGVFVSENSLRQRMGSDRLTLDRTLLDGLKTDNFLAEKDGTWALTEAAFKSLEFSAPSAPRLVPRGVVAVASEAPTASPDAPIVLAEAKESPLSALTFLNIAQRHNKRPSAPTDASAPPRAVLRPVVALCATSDPGAKPNDVFARYGNKAAGAWAYGFVRDCTSRVVNRKESRAEKAQGAADQSFKDKLTSGGPQPSKPRVAADLSRLPVRYFLNASAFIPLVCRVVSRDVATGGEITSTGFIYGTRKADGSDEQCVVIAATDAVCPPGGEPANTVTLQFFKETETRNDDLTEVEATYWAHSPSPVGSESRPLPMPIAPDNDNTEGWLMFALYLCPAAKIRGRLLEIYVPPLSTADPAGLANVNLIHHSGAKYVSLRAQVKDTAPADASFSYELKSIADARGSPVFTDAWELIGVHLGSGVANGNVSQAVTLKAISALISAWELKITRKFPSTAT